MKLLTIFFIFLHLCWSLPKDDNVNVNYEVKLDNGKITYESNLKNQNYAYNVITPDRTVKHENGHFEDGNHIVSGGYEYLDDNGVKYSVVYVADKDGYRPSVTFGLSPPPGKPGSQNYYPGAPGRPGYPGRPGQPGSEQGDLSEGQYPEIPGRPGVYYPPLLGTPGTPGTHGTPGRPGANIPAQEIDPKLLCGLVGSGC